MKLKSLQVCAAVGLLSGFLSSCGSTGDVVNPTISEMDRLDTQWGLAPRVSKGSSPRRNAAPQALLNTAPPSTPEYSPPPASIQAPISAPVTQPAPAVDPSVIQKLR
ncbi:MAG: hypothetical protein JWO89_297 [Verrucomicrobiaceae bacterium]|nr:hypothetical protein [Verrucomicrobiaceae bacterium]